MAPRNLRGFVVLGVRRDTAGFVKISRMVGRRLVLPLCIALLLGTIACTMWAEKKTSAWNSATSGEQLERLFWQDVKAQNWKSIESRLAPMMVTLNRSGALDRAGTLEYLKSFAIEDIQVGEIESRPAGADLVVTFTVSARGTVNGRPFAKSPLRMMSVWQQLSKGWVLVAHSSIEPEP
jgi:hypothetical protein